MYILHKFVMCRQLSWPSCLGVGLQSAFPEQDQILPVAYVFSPNEIHLYKIYDAFSADFSKKLD